MKRLILLGMICVITGCVLVDPFAGQPTLECPPICTGTGDFCDSDCDGWFDDFEISQGSDPCNSFDPPVCPPVQSVARLCVHIIGCDSLNEADDDFDEPVDTFVSGDVFSFLTPIETEVFLSLVVSNNIAIDQQVNAERNSALFDLGQQGLGGSSLTCAVKCGAERDRVRLKREATFIAVREVLALSGLDIDLLAFIEIQDFNCREYPNRSFVCSSSVGLPSITCTIDLPCG